MSTSNSYDNARQKQLPYIEPPFSTYQYYGATGIVSLQNPTAYNYYLNNCIQLTCERMFLTGYTSPWLCVSGAAPECLNFMERVSVRGNFIEGLELSVIRNMIDEGYYVYFNMIDVYYIEGMLWYGEKHNLHDGLICGYDDNDHTFTLAAYDNRWVYRRFKTSQESFMKAIAAGKERERYDGFIGYKVKNDEQTLDLFRIQELLELYLTSDPYGKLFEGPKVVRGIIVHDYLRLYLQFLLDGEIPYDRKDRRIMRLIYEHKKCMADRIAAVENKLGCPPDFSSRYAPAVESANRAHTYYVTYRMKQKDELLRLIQKELATMKAVEEDVLPDVLKLIKEAQNAVESSET